MTRQRVATGSTPLARRDSTPSLLRALSMTGLCLACSNAVSASSRTVPDASAAAAGTSGAFADAAGGSAASDSQTPGLAEGGHAGAAAASGGASRGGGAAAPTAGSSSDAASGSPASSGQASGGQAGGGGTASAAGDAGASSGTASGRLKHVFVIALENHDAPSVIGNTTDAPYLNDVLERGSCASSFEDELPKEVPSEPHYVWMEAGSNAFTDHTFESDDAPSAQNSTSETRHLVTELSAAGITWMSYQEGLSSVTGACPIAADGAYAPKHDPFVFFRDVSGSPPSKDNGFCAAHHAPLTRLLGDLKGEMAAYDFITPDLCHDMHGAPGCPEPNTIRAGDDWLAEYLPPLLDYIDTHQGVLFLTWDEGEATLTLPFAAFGPTVKRGFVSTKRYTHSSLLKTVQRILGVPPLDAVKAASDLSDLFALPPY